MPVCKYYLQGICKFGSNCNFDHPRDQTKYGANQQPRNVPQQYNPQQQQQQQYNQQQYNSMQQNRYKYVSNNASNYNQAQNQNTILTRTSNAQQQVQSPENARLSDIEFLDLVQKELSAWFNSNAWKLSCYSYTKSAPSIPFLEDVSPEEVRFYLYEAKRNNNFDQVNNQIKLKFQETLEKIKQIVNPNPQMIEFLLNYFHESEKTSNASPVKGLMTSSSSQAPNPFMKIVEQKQQQPHQGLFNPFQQTQKPSFAQPFQHNLNTQQPTQQPFNPFTQMISGQNNSTSQQPTQTLIFGQLSTPGQMSPAQFQPSAFNQQKQPLAQTTNLNPFANMPSTNIATASGGFMQGNIQNQPPTQALTNLNQTQLLNSNQTGIYSKIEDIDMDQVEEFKANQFTMGRIPSIPPTKDFCN